MIKQEKKAEKEAEISESALLDQMILDVTHN